MLLTITTTYRPATELGYLLHKRPDRFQSYELAFGKAHVFYPEATEESCAACLLLEVDPVGIVRGKGQGHDDAASNLMGRAKGIALRRAVHKQAPRFASESRRRPR